MKCKWFLLALFIFMGCSSHLSRDPSIKVIYQEVQVPVKCGIELPDKPKYDSDIIQSTINILEYIEKLTAAIEVCR